MAFRSIGHFVLIEVCAIGGQVVQHELAPVISQEQLEMRLADL